MLSCTVAQLLPTVTAEMIFAEKENADNVIATFNNKKVIIPDISHHPDEL